MSATPGDAPAGTPPETRLRDLRPTDAPVHVVARIVSVQRREYTRPADARRRIFLAGLLSDGTATVRFTWWDPPNEPIERGMVIRAVGATVREYQGRAELQFGFRTRLSPAAESELPPIDAETVPFRTIASLAPGEEGFRLEARVLRVDPKTVAVGTEQREIHEGLLGDGTGMVAFTSWSDFGLRAGETVRIAGTYVRRFRGLPQLVLDSRSAVQRTDGAALPEIPDPSAAPPVRLARLESEGGREIGSFEGVIVGLLPPSGLVFRCPNCRRTTRSGSCPVHGPVDPVNDLRCRLVVDDGTGTATVNLDRAGTERLSGMTLADALSLLEGAPDASRVEARLSESLFGLRLRVRGRIARDDFGLVVDPLAAERIDPVPDLGALAARVGAAGGADGPA
ncbi:MAG: hypothetical protein QXG65_05525 [Thermoplasmata archaeon]